MQKPNQKEFRVEKVIRRKGDELYVKWKGYDDSLNIWIDERTYSINEWMSEFSPKPKSIGGTAKLNYICLIMWQKHIWKATFADTSKFQKKIDLVFKIWNWYW